MTAFVSASASAQATETDFDGEKQRSKRGDGSLARRRLRGSADRLAAHRVRERHQHQPEVLLGHLRAGLDASPAVEIGEAAAEEPAGRRPRLGVVAGERGGPIGGAVAGGHRLHQVAEPASDADAADRDQGASSSGVTRSTPIRSGASRLSGGAAKAHVSGRWPRPRPRMPTV